MLAGSSSRPADAGNVEQDSDELVDIKKIGYLIRPEDRSDIENFLNQYPAIASEYIPVAVIGEGTFCRVGTYKTP